ncbi:hypothetical protein C5167_007840 [Papaver somniferum]|nr:hypothetical protein C5167_007840 [Papaver somniferum]
MAQFWKSHLKPHNISSMHERVLGSSHPCASLTDHYDPGCNRDDCLQFTNLDPSLLEYACTSSKKLEIAPSIRVEVQVLRTKYLDMNRNDSRDCLRGE